MLGTALPHLAKISVHACADKVRRGFDQNPSPGAFEQFRKPHVFDYLITQCLIAAGMLQHVAPHEKESAETRRALRFRVADAIEQTEQEKHPQPGRYHHSFPK